MVHEAADWDAARARGPALLPTTLASDAQGRRGRTGMGRAHLPHVVGGHPGPDLYEAMMGAPVDWTDPDADVVVPRVPDGHPGGIDVVSLCSGVGLLDLGLAIGLHERGYRARHPLMVEVDEWRREMLRRRYPGTETLADLRAPETLDRLRGLRGAAVLVGGIPCQPMSSCGRQEGRGDRRYLIPEFLEAVEAVGPLVVVAENVDGIRSGDHAAGLLRGLHDMGYDATWVEACAAAYGLPHCRPRWVCLAWRRDLPAAPVVAPSETRDRDLAPPAAPLSEVTGDDLVAVPRDAEDQRRVAACGEAVVVPMGRYLGRLVGEVLRWGPYRADEAVHPHATRPGVIVEPDDGVREVINIAGEADHPGDYDPNEGSGPEQKAVLELETLSPGVPGEPVDRGRDPGDVADGGHDGDDGGG